MLMANDSLRCLWHGGPSDNHSIENATELLLRPSTREAIVITSQEPYHRHTRPVSAAQISGAGVRGLRVMKFSISPGLAAPRSRTSKDGCREGKTPHQGSDTNREGIEVPVSV